MQRNVATPPIWRIEWLRSFRDELAGRSRYLLDVLDRIRSIGNEDDPWWEWVRWGFSYVDVRDSSGYNLDMEQTFYWLDRAASHDWFPLDAVLQFPDDARKWLPRLLEHIDEVLDELAQPQEALVAIEDAGEQRILEGWEKDFGDDPMGFTRDIAVELAHLPQTAANLVEVLLDGRDRVQGMIWLITGQDPVTEPVEVLYHASVVAGPLCAEGFDPGGPKGQRGIGQMGGVLPTVSFTADEEIAAEIARCLVEAVLISRGEIDVQELLEHVRGDGVLQQVQDYHRGSWGQELAPEAEPEEVFRFYTAYLAFAEGAGVRYNPVFSMAEAEHFVDVDLAGVGYLAAEVDMEGVEEYLPSMLEYRVRPDHILRCVRWVKGETPW